MKHFSNAGFPCPIMQSPSDHFLRAINTDFDRIIAMCKNIQDDHGDLSSVNMDTAVAIRTLEATFKSSADAAAVEAMILKLTEKEGPLLKSRGKAGKATKIAVLIWRSLLVMSREWKYYWLRLVLFMLLALCIGTVFSGLGHSLSSVVVRVAAMFVFVSFTSLLSIAGVTAHMNEIKTYACEASNKHSGPIVFLLGQLLSSIPFLFLIAISSSLVFYFLIGLRDEFSLLMYFVLNFFMCLLVNEGLLLAVASVQLDVFWSILTLVVVHVVPSCGLTDNQWQDASFGNRTRADVGRFELVCKEEQKIIMMLSAGYFRLRSDLPGTLWNYPLSYIALHTYSIQARSFGERVCWDELLSGSGEGDIGLSGR
ncbi:hypothetical protein KSS87_006486 [Heliosperma pusillum]|nr:hypothetical protein KSS87_006486 [Heliosperma pusillum]